MRTGADILIPQHPLCKLLPLLRTGGIPRLYRSAAGRGMINPVQLIAADILPAGNKTARDLLKQRFHVTAVEQHRQRAHQHRTGTEILDLKSRRGQGIHLPDQRGVFFPAQRHGYRREKLLGIAVRILFETVIQNPLMRGMLINKIERPVHFRDDVGFERFAEAADRRVSLRRFPCHFRQGVQPVSAELLPRAA